MVPPANRLYRFCTSWYLKGLLAQHTDNDPPIYHLGNTAHNTRLALFKVSVRIYVKSWTP